MLVIDLVEFLRTKMLATAERKSSLHDPEVVMVSQQLDRILMQVERNKRLQQFPPHGLVEASNA